METSVRVCFYCKEPEKSGVCPKCGGTHFIKVLVNKTKIKSNNIFRKIFPKYHYEVLNPRLKYIEKRLNKNTASQNV